MSLIVSRGFPLPKTAPELRAAFYFSLWSRNHWPLQTPLIGREVVLYQSTDRTARWLTHITRVEVFVYESKRVAKRELNVRFGTFDETQTKFREASEADTCIAIKCEPLRHLSKARPANRRLPQLGWADDKSLFAHFTR